MAEKDYATTTMLQWFIKEQIEEESNDLDIIDVLKITGEKSVGIFYSDKKLGIELLQMIRKKTNIINAFITL